MLPGAAIHQAERRERGHGRRHQLRRVICSGSVGACAVGPVGNGVDEGSHMNIEDATTNCNERESC